YAQQQRPFDQPRLQVVGSVRFEQARWTPTGVGYSAAAAGNVVLGLATAVIASAVLYCGLMVECFMEIPYTAACLPLVGASVDVSTSAYVLRFADQRAEFEDDEGSSSVAEGGPFYNVDARTRKAMQRNLSVYRWCGLATSLHRVADRLYLSSVSGAINLN
ncbi:hypothetical protein FOZ60_005639, partial [Perkinsus olseni]